MTIEKSQIAPSDLDSMLALMIKKDASDLFVTVGLPPTLKVNGVVKPLVKWSFTVEQVKVLVQQVMSPEQKKDFEETLEANFAINKSKLGRFRINVFRQQNEVGMVLRRIKTEIPTIEELSLPLQMAELAMAKRGLVIVVGATNSGKSTTLASLVGYRNEHSRGHIVSVEDPVEFVHVHKGCIVTQREVGIDTHSFGDALKNTLRQSPDVILIGEIRTRETMEHAITFAETGHLVLTTLHASTANQALDRIVNFFPEDRRSKLLMDLSLNLKAIVAQRLVPLAKTEGRRVVMEVLHNTPLISDLIVRGENHLLRDVMKKSNAQGMNTFEQALYKLYREGIISSEDAMHFADSANELRLMIKLGEENNIEDLAGSLDGVTLKDFEEGGGNDVIIRPNQESKETKKKKKQKAVAERKETGIFYALRNNRNQK